MREPGTLAGVPDAPARAVLSPAFRLVFRLEIANRPGKPPLDEYYERICVENNGGFGQVATTQAR